MTRRFRIALAALVPALVAGTPAARAQAAGARAAAPGLSLSYVRYWRAPASTLVEGLVRVDFSALSGAATQPPRVDFEVRDDAGRTLHSENWNVSVDQALIASGRSGEVTTPFTVALAAGNYTVAVHLTHGAAVDSVLVPVQGYAAAPGLSDLLASPQIRISNDTGPLAPSEMRRGRYVVERAPEVRLRPDDARLAYYLELYPGNATAAPESVAFDVRTVDGSKTLVHTGQTAQVVGNGVPLVGRLELAGLPPGDYDLVVRLQRGPTAIERKAPFSMLSLAQVPPAVVSAPPQPAARAAGSADSAILVRYLSPLVLSDSALKRLADALALAPPGPPLPRALRTVTPEAQRRLIAQYFARQGVTGVNKSSLFEEYTARLDEVDRLFSEKQLRRSGVHTDRGRIYMKYGPPDDKTSVETQDRHNVELWKYTRQRSLRFLFLDMTGFGNLSLIVTTDPNEPSMPDWDGRLNDPQVQRMFLQ